MRKRTLLVLLGSICLVLVLAALPFMAACPAPAEEEEAPPPPPEKVYEWRMQTHWPSGAGYYQDVYLPFSEKVEKASGGRIKITPFPPDTIVPTKDMFEAVGAGQFEIAWGFPAYWIGKCPAAAFLNGQLYTWENYEEAHSYFYDMGAIEPAREAYAEHNLYVWPMTSGGVAIYSNKAVRTIDDFKGLKIRSTGIPADVLARAGAATVYFPGAELIPAIEMGTCDAAHWGAISAGWEMHFQEVTRYILMPYLVEVTCCEIFVNLDTWNALPEDLKWIVNEVALETAATNHSWFELRDYQDMKAFEEEYGGEIVWMDQASVDKMRGYSLEVSREWGAKDKYAGEMEEILEDFLRLTGRM